MIALGQKRTARRLPLLALPGLWALFLLSGCAMIAPGPPGGTGGGGGFPGGGPGFPGGGPGFPGGGPGFPGGGWPGLPGGGGPAGGMSSGKQLCFCDVSQIPVCCDECPEAPVCQAEPEPR